MFALRNLLLLNLLALCSFATTVNPLVGYLQWSSNLNTGQGYFEVFVHTNTNDGSAQVADYVKLINVNLAIDIQVGQSILTQSVSLHRAFSQAQVVSAPATNILFPSVTCAPADCVNAGNYFTQSIGPDQANGFSAPVITAARLTYTAIAHTTPVNNPYWQYVDPNTQTTTLFTPHIIARTITLTPGPSFSFVYDGTQSPLAYLNVSGEAVPEPATALLCGAGLAVAFVYRRRRASAPRR
jgi:hypothetical protein